MPILIVAVALFVTLIAWLIFSDLLEQKDKIIADHLRTVRAMEKKNKEKMDVDLAHKKWLVDIAHLTKITEIKKLLIDYAQPKTKKPVDPNAKVKYTSNKSNK